MPLSDLAYPRFKYARTSLKAVVCQLKFNPILRIGQEVPAGFQDSVRQEFPTFAREESTGFRIAPGRIEPLPPQPAVLRFQTEDGNWTAGLAVDNLSLETTAYLDFPDFERRWLVLERAFQAVYGVDHYIRIGLRYINTFDESDFPGGWLDKFNTHLLGPLADPVLGEAVRQCAGACVFRDAEWAVTINHAREEGRYILDIDHYSEGKHDAEDVAMRLQDFNRRIYQVFRWAITDTMHQLMEPGPHD